MNKQYYLSEVMCKLINIVTDPTPIIKYLENKSTDTKPIQDIISSLSLKELGDLWNIFINLKYSKDPKDIIKELQANLKNCIKE